MGHCWRSKNELINDTLLWTPSDGWAKTRPPARTYLQQLCADTGYSLEDLLGAMDDRAEWWERVREICTGSATWWRWGWWNGFKYSKSVNSSIWLIDRIWTGTTTSGQSGSGSNGKEGVLHIPQSSMTGDLPSDGLVLYQGHLLGGGGSYPSVEVQLAYSKPQLTGWNRRKVWFYGISTFVGYLMPNPFLCK